MSLCLETKHVLKSFEQFSCRFPQNNTFKINDLYIFPLLNIGIVDF